jgi:hypothetical protein
MPLSVTLNGVTFTGSVYASDSTRRAPQKVEALPRKVGEEVPGIDGSLNIMLENSGDPKVDHKLFWQGAPEVTRAAAYATWLLNTTFTAILPQGTFTKQCGLEDYEETEAFTLPNGTRYFDVTLTLRAV